MGGRAPAVEKPGLGQEEDAGADGQDAGPSAVGPPEGVGCNGADKAALKLARLGRPVKLMIGGHIGWADEGFSFVEGFAQGSVDAA